jgi:hypothetical protein
MAKPNSRETLIQYCLRKLGAPVIEINVDWQQCEERLDDALDFFTERHFDGVEKIFFRYQIQQKDITNQYISIKDVGPPNGVSGPTGNDIVSVVRVLQFGNFSNINMFDVRYQMALTDYFGINRNLAGTYELGLAGYDSMMRYIKLIEDFFQPEKAIQFSKVSGKLHLNMDWDLEVNAGDWIVIQAYAIINPEEHTKIYDDRYLKKYLAALIKRQWGANMSKFDGVALPGGVTMRGATIYAEAVQEIAAIEQEFLSNTELPIDFMTG